MSAKRTSPLHEGNGYGCPKCNVGATMVRDSRQTAAGEVRRRRKCLSCGHLFTTVESVEQVTVSARNRLYVQLASVAGRMSQILDELNAEHLP